MKYRYRALGFLFLLSIITYIDRVCINLLGKDMQSELGITPDRWGWVLGAFALSYALFEVPTGAMADRSGPRKTAARIVVWWSVFTSLTGMVQNFWQLVSCRFLFGAGEAGAYPTSSATISRWFPLKERARATGIVWMGSRVGGAVSPFIVLTLAESLGWRGTFGVFAVFGVIWVSVWYWWFRDTPKQMAGVSATELAEIGPPPEHMPHGLPWSVALRDSNFWTLLLMYHTYCWGSFFYLSWLTDYLREGRGYDNADLKSIAWLPFAVGACGNLFGGWLSDRLCPKIGLKWARCLIGAGGLFVAGFLMMGTHFAPGKLLPLVLLALGYGAMDAMLPVAWAVCLDIGRKYAGSVSGSMNMAGQLGSFMSSVAFGYMVRGLIDAGWSKPDAYNMPLLPFSVMLLISGALFLRVDPNRQLIPEAPEKISGLKAA
jgi:ACS family glucarate transporter-like MFS transporter